MDPFTIIAGMLGAIIFVNKFDCSSKRYKCRRCNHCFDEPRDVGYDYCDSACPECGSQDLIWQAGDKL